MSRHSNSREINPIIELVLVWFTAGTDWLRSWLDRASTRVVTYFSATPVRTIITDFLAYAAVFGILLFPVFMAILAAVIML